MLTHEKSLSEFSSSSDDQNPWPKKHREIESANSARFNSRGFDRLRETRRTRRGFEVGEASSRSGRVSKKIEVPIGDDRNAKLGKDREEIDEIDDVVDDDDEEDKWMCNDEEFDSDDLSSDAARKSKWLRGFFERLTGAQIEDDRVKMHCPACRGGPGENVWYVGFNAVVAHAEKVNSRRVRLHRRFAEILRGELEERKAKVSESEGLEWKGLEGQIEDRMIVWPPMVIVQNTRSRKDATGKWTGLDHAELRCNFKHYDIKGGKSAYGPAGHCGVNVLIFEKSGMGYMEAQRLHDQFLKEGRGRHEWEVLRRRFHASRERLLFGYMATEEDMELFNKHSKGNRNCKFEMKSYKMMIDSLRKMRENDSKLIELEASIAQEREENNSLKKAYQEVDEKLCFREREIQTIRQRASKEIEESKRETDCLDKHYGDYMEKLTNEIEELKREREVLLQKSQESSQKLELCEREILTTKQLASEELQGPSDQVEHLENSFGDIATK